MQVSDDFHAQVPDELRERVRADVDRFGWHVALVPPEDGTPGWAHTIGLAEGFAHPEILVFGPELPLLHRLLNRLGESVRAGTRYEPGSAHAGILQGFHVAFRAIESKWYAPFLGNAAWHYQRKDFPAVQCFWPDAADRFPWQAESDPQTRDQQPLLFRTETHRALSEALIAVLRREGAL